MSRKLLVGLVGVGAFLLNLFSWLPPAEAGINFYCDPTGCFYFNGSTWIQVGGPVTTQPTGSPPTDNSGPPPTQPPAPSAIAFPMVGLENGETLTLNAISLNACGLLLEIFDGNGALLATKSQAPTPTVTIMYTHLEIEYPKGGGNPRMELRANVTLQPPTTAPCNAQATVEVFDHGSKATTLVTSGIIPPGPANTPPAPTQFGPFGLDFKQTARLNVVAFPPNPCTGIISFIDTTGRSVGGPSNVTLGAAQATFLDLPGQAVVHDAQSSAEVIAMFTPTAGTAPGVCIPAVEVFDQGKGFTRVLIPPGPPYLPAVAVPPT